MMEGSEARSPAAAAAAAAAACKQGCALLHTLQGSLQRCPVYFLSQARALIFYTSMRVGAGLGVERGSGFLLSRLPFSALSSCHGDWSPPCFMVETGVEAGAAFGVETLDCIIGIMSEHALQDFTNWKVVLSSGMGTCLGSKDRVSPHTELTLSSDLCCVAVDSRGAMVEVGLTGCIFHPDAAKNEATYGRGVTPADIVGGRVPTPPEMEPLIQAIAQTSQMANVAAFDDRTDAGDSEW